MYILQYTKVALEDLACLEKNVARRILKKLDFYVETREPLKFAKRLTNFREGEYRFRIGDYRVIFDIGENGEIAILHILMVKHRKEIYI